MTGKEAYELVVKYCGGEDGLLMISEMIHLVGVNETVKRVSESYAEKHRIVPPDFEEWMRQAFKYMETIQNNNN